MQTGTTLQLPQWDGLYAPWCVTWTLLECLQLPSSVTRSSPYFLVIWNRLPGVDLSLLACKLELMLVEQSNCICIWLLMSKSVQRVFVKVLSLELSLKQPSQTNVRGVNLSHLIWSWAWAEPWGRKNYLRWQIAQVACTGMCKSVPSLKTR